MKPLGLNGLHVALKSANGPAQHLLMGVWGLIVTSGFWAVNVPIPFLVVWALCSFAVVYCTIWAHKTKLLYALKADTLLTVTVLFLYLWEEYTTGITTLVFFVGRVAAASVLIAHGFYLIDLVHRQILDARAFERANKKDSVV